MLDKDRYVDKQIGNYRIVKQLGSSSPVSKTYQAERLDLKYAFVAFKIFHTIHLSQDRREQFLKEVQLHKRLSHPHLLALLDAGLNGDVPYLVTEFVAGNSLRERLRNQPGHILPLQEAVTILTQVGQALHYAHQRNIVHAHLKPENVMLRAGHEVLLTDFRIDSVTELLSSQDAYPAAGYPYMAPEQFEGWMNKSSDQYTLGCIAYELLTGRVPFSAPTFALMEQRLTEKPTAPTQLNLLLPIALELVILKAMEKKSADRYPTVQDFVTALGLSVATYGRKSLSTSVARPAQSPAHALGSGSLSIAPRPRMGGINRDQAFQALRAALPTGAQLRHGVSVVKPLRLLATPTDSTSSQPGEIESKPRADEPEQGLANQLTMAQAAPASTAELHEPELTSVGSQVAAGSAARVAPPAGSALRSRAAGTPQRQNAWPIIVGSWLIAIVITTALLYTVFSGTFTTNPASPAPVYLQARQRTATMLPSPTPSPTPRQFQLPALAGRVMPTPTPTPSPSPTPTTGLTSTPASLPTASACRLRGGTYKCAITLQLAQSSANNLTWSASGSNLSTFIFPANGTLSPGQQQNVSVYVKATCPLSGTLVFSTQAGNLSVPWSC